MTLLDVVLVLVLIGFLVAGLARGVWVTIGGAAGFLVGATAAFFAIPLVAGWVPHPLGRIAAVIGCALVLIAAGHALGTAAGSEVQRLFRSPMVRTVSSLIGGALNLAVALIVIAALSFSVQAMGFPQVNQHMRQSVVLQTIDGAVPDSVETMFAEVRSTVMASDIPEIAQLLVPEAEEVPEGGELTEAALATTQSVARVTGVAQACGQSQTGSGVAVSPNRVVTNAHVVAGVSEPSVELPDGQVVTGRAVYFNPASDIALLAVDTLAAAPAPVGGPMEPGEQGYVMGYPSGGPFVAGPALVQARDVSSVNNIYGGSPSELEIYQVSADVRQGNSGGPLVNADGEVAGVVFARAVEGNSVGFAVTAESAGDVLAAPDTFTDTVSTGQCVDR
ncbi:MarP family serine protease [Nesterenkonia sp.]|uniref:MarP family serine protease n=1 Tax=Nesterenkonia sp. TaxID=704201 RepID=UPI0026379347|nr:MarP family serine protease [Nesterenkonia sp.]